VSLLRETGPVWLRGLLAVVAVLGLWGCDGDPSARPPGSPDLRSLALRVTGQDFQWIVRYPGADGRLDTADDLLDLHDIHVPAGTRVHVELVSRDYLYGFQIPDLGVNQIAVPDLRFSVDFTAAGQGEFPLRCDQFCGISKTRPDSRVVVHDAADFRRWMGGVAAKPKTSLIDDLIGEGATSQ
jgi:cytochrome c oxidase subunit 2